MVKLREIYADVLARLDQHDTQKISFSEIVNAINDVIKQQRVNYVSQGRYEPFVKTEVFYTSIASFEFPFLNSIELENDILDDVPIESVLINGVVQFTDNELENTIQSWNKGDLAVKDGEVYIALQDITSTNTFNLTFNIDETKFYYPDNGIDYFTGDIVYNGFDKKYYRVNSNFTSGVTNPSFTELVWKHVTSNNKPTYFYPFNRIHELKLFNKDREVYGFTVNRSKIFLNKLKDDKIFTLSYVPKWTEVKNLNDDVDIPDFMISNVKNGVLQIIGAKLGLNLIDSRVTQAETANE